jgi:methionine synthase II (cobalamin-independent)
MKRAPFRADIVGSFLRPAALKNAREDFKNGKIGQKELTSVEESEIKKLVELEIKHGLKAVTDGEFRRGTWHADFFLGLKGFIPFTVPGGHKFANSYARGDAFVVNGKIEYNPDHPFFEHYKYLRSITPPEILAKISIPSPSMCFVLSPDMKPPFYTSNDEFLNDLAKAYNLTIKKFYDLGCRYIQLDDTYWCRSIRLGTTAEKPEDFALIDAMGNNSVTVVNLAIKFEFHNFCINL